MEHAMKRVRLLLWGALAVAAVAAFAAQRIYDGEGTSKGDFGRVPQFALRDQRDRPVTDRDLRDTVWVANFVFTRCPSVCPMLTAKFQALQARLRELEGVRFVSISVDPEYDTPEVLAAYAARYQADDRRWWFLTGPLAEIERTVVQGFKVHRGDPRPSELDPTLVDIMHGEHFVLVDREGVISGYYPAEQERLAEVEAALRALLR
jgi:protein SCO1